MNLMPAKMTNAECRMEQSRHSSSVIRHSTQETSKTGRPENFAFGRHINHSQHQRAPIGRRSPGRKALFSSIHPAPASWTASAGFTLIEVILALGVCAVVLVVIGTVFASALKLQNSAAAAVDEKLPIERAMNQMRRDLKNAVGPGGMLEGPLQSGSLEGGVNANDGIQIYTTTGLMTPNTPWSEIQKVTYALQAPSDSSVNGKELVRAVTRNLLATGEQDEDDQFLANGIQTMTFSYYDGQNWLDTWDDTTETNLPIAVRVSVQLAPKDSTQDAPAPMQLLVPLMVQVHTNELDNSDSDTNGVSGGD
ncbi:MAG TPA: type II secretion system protein GspJ [Candidatus Polarisedimenticolia bacterium]|nr:type II secretion system protein GspJ [Candidatus Polarisedimenticolia bacterium]